MSSTFTPSYRLALQADGDNIATWGQVANTVFTLTELGNEGNISKALIDGDNVLTTANNSLDEARYSSLELTGALTAAATVVVPDVPKKYIVKNSTTGGQVVSIRNTSSGSGIAIPVNTSLTVYCNGTTIRAVTPAVLDNGNLNQLSGALSVTDVTASGAVSSGSLAVSGTSTLAATTITGTTSVTGAGGLAVTSDAAVGGNLTLTGSSKTVSAPIGSFPILSSGNATITGGSVSGVTITGGTITGATITGGSVPGSVVTGAVAQVAPDAQFSHTVPSGVNSGTATAGSWQTRLLNTQDWNNISGSSFGGASDITLPAGSYYIEANSSFFRVNGCKIALYNVSDSAFSINGGQSYFPQSGYVGGTLTLSGRVTIASAKTFELRYFVGITQSADGQGNNVSSGINEVFATVRIWKYV